MERVHLDSALSQFSSKYKDLVWYARKPNFENKEDWQEYFKDTPDDIILQCRMKLLEVEAKYSNESTALACPLHGDWAHGFNSGCLAMARWITEALDDADAEDDLGNLVPSSGIENANENFPDLDV